jgi:hypothetical protein
MGTPSTTRAPAPTSWMVRLVGAAPDGIGQLLHVDGSGKSGPNRRSKDWHVPVGLAGQVRHDGRVLAPETATDPSRWHDECRTLAAKT